MAVEDSENPSFPGARLSPGDAAFERLTRREALKAKDEPASFLPVSDSAAAVLTGFPVMPASGHMAKAEAAPKSPASHDEPTPPEPPDVPAIPATVAPTVDSAKADSHEPVDRIIAMAAAFGIEAAGSTSASEPPAPITPAESADPAPAPAIAPEKTAARAAPPSSPADATAARLEAALLNQLKSLEETLAEDAPRTPAQMPPAAPLRPAKGIAKASDFIGPPRRSTFAPDPVRQRTYVDLRAPAPARGKATANDAPWRKYLTEPRRPATPERAPSRRPATRPAGKPSPVVATIYDRKAEAEERGRGIRAMSAAAVLGLGVGLGLLVLIRPFTDSVGTTPVASVSEITAQAVAATPPATDADTKASAAARSGSPVNLALATLLADPRASRSSAGQPAVISEPGITPPAPVAAPSTEAPAPVVAAAAQPPVVIRPPPGEAQPVARVPDFDSAQSGPLAYVPAIPSYDPVRQQLLEREAVDEPASVPRTRVAARAPVDEAPPPQAIRPGRATINGFVNLRSKPDNAAPVVAILAEGLSVKVIACDYWCEIEAGGKRGFVFKKFVSR